MTEIPEHLRKRAQEARESAIEQYNTTEFMISMPESLKQEQEQDPGKGYIIPAHLLERSRVKREKLAAWGSDRMNELSEIDQDEDDSKTGGYLSRLTGVLDMYSEPCSLLTEHIASSVRDLAKTEFADFSDEARYQRRTNNLPKTRQFIDAPNRDARERRFATIRLTDSISSGDRQVHLELAAPIITKERKGLFFSREVEDFETPGYLYLLAITRGDVAVPVMQIATNRDNPNCSYVILPEEADQIGEVVVTDKDVKPREEALNEFWDLLKGLPSSILGGVENDSRIFDVTLLDRLGATAQLDRVLGESDTVEEYILLHLQQQNQKETKSGSTHDSIGHFHHKKLDVKVGNTEYPAMITSTKERLDGSAVRISTSVELLHAKNFAAQKAFPDIIVNPAATDSIMVEGIDDPQESARIIREFADYLDE